MTHFHTAPEKAYTTTPNKSPGEFTFAPSNTKRDESVSEFLREREATRNGLVRSTGDTDEQMSARFEAAITNYDRPVLDLKARMVDPKTEARRANEEAAKRLIANPPDWAYPMAWMCAVLQKVERNGMTAERLMREFGKDGMYTVALRSYATKRLEGITHDEAKWQTGLTHLADAYARGMERTSPMTRQGVKRGISTCDLGVDYE